MITTERLTGLERAAVHESGHAVVAETLGLRVREVQIEPNQTVLEDETPTREMALMLLSGFAAEAKHSGEEFSLVGHLSSNDYEEAHGILIFKLRLGGRVLIDARDEVVTLVEENWPAIVRLSEALLERQTLSGDQVRACIAEAA